MYPKDPEYYLGLFKIFFSLFPYSLPFLLTSIQQTFSSMSCINFFNLYTCLSVCLDNLMIILLDPFSGILLTSLSLIIKSYAPLWKSCCLACSCSWHCWMSSCSVQKCFESCLPLMSWTQHDSKPHCLYWTNDWHIIQLFLNYLMVITKL